MRKTKLAICFGDKEYQKRFVKCFMHHYEKIYEVHILDSLEDLLGMKDGEFPLFLLEGIYEKVNFICAQKIICLVEKDKQMLLELSQEDIVFTDKYQEVYKIEQLVRQHLREIGIETKTENNSLKQVKKIGVFSLECESAQLPFCGMLGEEYGEQAEVLLLDLQMLSGLGLEKMQDDMNRLTIEDLLTAAATGVYTRKRLLDAIGSEQNWEYIYPPLNMQCLAEASKQTYDTMLELLIKEFGYQIVLINFGVVFDGVYEWMSNCDGLFFLVSHANGQTQREIAFYEELKRQGKDYLFEQMVRIEIAHGVETSDSWKRKAQQWRWGEIGDQVRKYIQKVC